MSGVRKIAKSNFYKIFFIDILEDKEIIDLLKKSEINEKIIKSMHTYASKERKEILFKKSDTIANLKYILDKNEDYDYTFLSKLENQFDEDILKNLSIA